MFNNPILLFSLFADINLSRLLAVQIYVNNHSKIVRSWHERASAKVTPLREAATKIKKK